MNEHPETIVAFTQLQRSYHNHVLHYMIFFIITGLPLLSTSFSFIGSFFAIPYDFLGSVYPVLSTSGLTDNERLAAGLQVARVIHRITALLFVVHTIPFVVVQLVHVRSWAIWPEESWGPAALFRGIKGLWVNYICFGHVRIGKFNVGQKLFAWTMILAVTAITLSGFVLMFRDGGLPSDYVRSHHPIWYENLTGKKGIDPKPAEKAEQSVADEKLITS